MQWWLPHHANKFDFGVIVDFGNDNTKELVICHMTYSPFTKMFIKRKLNVQNRLSEFDYKNNYGLHHVTDIDKIYKTKRFYDQLTVNLVGEINRLEYRRMTIEEMNRVLYG